MVQFVLSDEQSLLSQVDQFLCGHRLSLLLGVSRFGCPLRAAGFELRMFVQELAEFDKIPLGLGEGTNSVSIAGKAATDGTFSDKISKLTSWWSRTSYRWFGSFGAGDYA